MCIRDRVVTDTYKHETFDELKINRDRKSTSCKLLLYRYYPSLCWNDCWLLKLSSWNSIFFGVGIFVGYRRPSRTMSSQCFSNFLHLLSCFSLHFLTRSTIFSCVLFVLTGSFSSSSGMAPGDAPVVSTELDHLLRLILLYFFECHPELSPQSVFEMVVQVFIPAYGVLPATPARIIQTRYV